MAQFSLLKKEHDLEPFDCAVPVLNEFLKKHALSSQSGHFSKTHVLFECERVIGYYSLVFGAISRQDVTERFRRGAGNYQQLPIILIARIAIDLSFQGYGKALLKDGLQRCIRAREIAGLRAVVVDAKDENAKSFYQHFGFEASPSNKFRLSLLMKDIKKNFEIIENARVA